MVRVFGAAGSAMAGVFVFLILGITAVDLTWGFTADRYYGFSPPFLVVTLLGVSTGLLLNSPFLGSKWPSRILPNKWTRFYCAVGLLVLIWVACFQYLSAVATVRIQPSRPLSEKEVEQLRSLCPGTDWKYLWDMNACRFPPRKLPEDNVILVRRNSEAREQIERYVGSMSRNLEQEPAK